MERHLEAEPSTIQLVNPESTREEIAEIYYNVYQLLRALGRMLRNREMEELIHQEILDSVKNASGIGRFPHCQGRN